MRVKVGVERRNEMEWSGEPKGVSSFFAFEIREFSFFSFLMNNPIRSLVYSLVLVQSSLEGKRNANGPKDAQRDVCMVLYCVLCCVLCDAMRYEQR